MAIKIKREKENIYFYREDGRRYRLSLEDGLMYSLADERMASIPKILQKGVADNIYHDESVPTDIRLAMAIYRNFKPRDMKPCMEYLAVVMNYYPNFKRYSEITNLHTKVKGNHVKATPKDLASMCKWLIDKGITETERYCFCDYNGSNYNLVQIYREWYDEVQAQSEYIRLGIKAEGEFTEEMSKYLYTKLSSNSCFKALSDDKQKRYAQWFKGVMCKGIWNILHYTKYSYAHEFLNPMISNIITFHEDMGIDLEKTNNPIRYYGEMAKSYYLWSTKHEEERFRAQYKNWENIVKVETDELCIVLPKSPQALVAEGIAQSNCVGGYGDMILNGKRIVIFVRQKSNKEASYITCDFYPANGGKWTLNQYYRANNNYANSDIERNMKKALLEWVDENINNR